MMLFHEMLLLMLILHAAVYVPRTRQHWRAWLAAALLPPCLALLLNLLNDPQRAVDIMAAHNLAETSGQDLHEYFKFHFLHPEKVVPYILTLWEMFPRNFWLGLLIFAAPPTVCALLIAACLRREADFGGCHSLANLLQGRLPAARFVDRHNILIVLPLASLFMLPIVIVAADWSRFLVMGWWGAMAAFIYLLHVMPAGGRQSARKRSIRLGAAAAFFFAAAYLYGGSTVASSIISRPWSTQCARFCIPYLTVNPLGDAYSAAAFNALADSLLPLHASGTNIKDSADRMDRRQSDLRADEDGRLHVPAGYRGRIFKMALTLRQGVHVVTVRHNAAAAPSLVLKVLGNIIPPARRAAEETQWRFSFPYASGIPEWEIWSVDFDGMPFAIRSLSIERE